jgi:hypothetical protein
MITYSDSTTETYETSFNCPPAGIIVISLAWNIIGEWFTLAVFLRNLNYAAENIGEIEMDMKLDSGDWLGEETFSTPSKYFKFEDGDGFIFGYQQPLLVNSLGVYVNPPIQAIDRNSPIISIGPVIIQTVQLPSSVYFGNAFALDASPTDLSNYQIIHLI